MRVRYWLILIIAGILIGLSAHYYATRIGRGDPAPGFSLKDRAGRIHALDDYRGNIVIVHFWATWCDICRMEIPALEHIHRMYENRGLAILSLLEDEREAAKRLDAFTEHTRISFPVLFDQDGAVARRYESWAVPESFIVDRDGTILKRISGGIDWNGMPYVAYIERVLRGDG